ncbi:hypothetical protein M0802_006754 [Mischocyttarus mexicanus]|nr:hypothetical protein M0802_006754 [Mischocyttarus mexicanus]
MRYRARPIDFFNYAGVMNAADYYGLDELRKACAGFVQCCITVDTVCALLASAERYIQYKCTKSLVQKVLEFVDEHGNEVLNLGSFTLLPQHVVRLILAREELRADEFTKFQAALMWSKKYYDSNQDIPLKGIIGNFLEYIQFHKIPTNALVNEVHPLSLVPDNIIMNALAYQRLLQADPTSVEPGKLSPPKVRKQGRSMSVQSSLEPYGSNTTLSSSGSDTGFEHRQHSGFYEQQRNSDDAPTDAEIEEWERKKLQREEQQRQQEQQQQQQEQRHQEEEQRQKEQEQQQREENEQQQREENEQQQQRQQLRLKEEDAKLREEKEGQQRFEEQEIQMQQLQLQEQKQDQEQHQQQQQQQQQTQQQQQQQQQQQNVHPVEGVGGLYIRLVLRREGRADLVWLYKTHKF